MFEFLFGKRKPRVGLFAGACDPLLHPAHICGFRDAIVQGFCDSIVVALHVDPRATNPQHPRVYLSPYERTVLVRANRYVHDVLLYQTEAELEALTDSLAPSVRILSSEFCDGRPYGGQRTHIPEFFYDDYVGPCTDRIWDGDELRTRILGNEYWTYEDVQ
jgi:hypothetical protein